MFLKVKFRIARPEDLKRDLYSLKIGQTYAITQKDRKNISGIFSIKGDEDPFILKHYLDQGLILIPENDPSFSEWIKDETNINSDR